MKREKRIGVNHWGYAENVTLGAYLYRAINLYNLMICFVLLIIGTLKFEIKQNMNSIIPIF